MHGNDNLRQSALPLRLLQLLLQCRGAHVVGIFINIDEVHIRTAVACTVRRGDKGNRTRPEEVAFPKTCRKAGDMKRRGCVTDSHCIFYTAVCRDALLKALDRRSLR